MAKHSHSGGLRVRLTVLMVWWSWDKWISIGPVTLQACLEKSFPRHADPYPHSRSWHTIPSCGKLWKNIQISSPCRCFQAPTIISNTHQWLRITLRPPRTLCLGGLYLGSHNTAPVWYRTRQIRNSPATAFLICLPKASHFVLSQPESLPSHSFQEDLLPDLAKHRGWLGDNNVLVTSKFASEITLLLTSLFAFYKLPLWCIVKIALKEVYFTLKQWQGWFTCFLQEGRQTVSPMMVERPKKRWGSYIQVMAMITFLAWVKDDEQGRNQILIWSKSPAEQRKQKLYKT